MLIGKKIKIESDSMNVILSRKVKRAKKDTKEKYDAWETIGYYSTPENALHALANLQIAETELRDLKSIVAEIEKLHHMIESLPQTYSAIREGMKG